MKSQKQKQKQKKQSTIKETCWNKEIRNRKKFGISTDLFDYGFTCTSMCCLEYRKDFDMLFSAYYTYKSYNTEYKLIHDSFSKYKKYTFKQLKEAGGILSLSKLCPMVYNIFGESINYRNTGIKIYHKHKIYLGTKFYPDGVNKFFKQNSRCKAVAILYTIPLTRHVLFEKLVH
jgi:hypothetical protein